MWFKVRRETGVWFLGDMLEAARELAQRHACMSQQRIESHHASFRPFSPLEFTTRARSTRARRLPPDLMLPSCFTPMDYLWRQGRRASGPYDLRSLRVKKVTLTK